MKTSSSTPSPSSPSSSSSSPLSTKERRERREQRRQSQDKKRLLREQQRTCTLLHQATFYLLPKDVTSVLIAIHKHQMETKTMNVYQTERNFIKKQFTSIHNKRNFNVLTVEKIESLMQNGYLIIDEYLTKEEIMHARNVIESDQKTRWNIKRS